MKNTQTKKKEATLFIHTLDHEGRGLARDEENKVFIVDNALLESKVRIEIDQEKKNLAFGHSIEVIEESPYKVKAKCEHALICGGCTWQDFDYNEQIKAKEKIVRDAFSKIAKYELAENFSVKKAENTYKYRNKMEFSFGFTEDDDKVLGLKMKRSHACVKVDCELCSPIVNKVIHKLEELCFIEGLEVFYTEHKEARGFLRSVVTRTNSDNSQLLLEIITFPRPEHNQTLYTICRTLKEEFPQITGIIHSTRKNMLPLPFGEKAIAQFGSKEMKESLKIVDDTLTFTYGFQSFFQINTQETSQLYTHAAQAVHALDISKCADIYCGVGGIGLSIAHTLKKEGKNIKLFGLEANKQACEFAKKNADTLGIEAEYTQADAKQLSKFFKSNKALDLLILDPPRSGVDKESLQALLRVKIKHLLIISCNPATLARDFALLQEEYEIKTLQSYDLFPHTPHVESLVLLTRKK